MGFELAKMDGAFSWSQKITEFVMAVFGTRITLYTTSHILPIQIHAEIFHKQSMVCLEINVQYLI